MAFKQHHKDNWNGNKQHKDGLKMWKPWRILNKQNKLRGNWPWQTPSSHLQRNIIVFYIYQKWV